MKIIHCSDIHLDSKMESNLTKQQAAQRSSELRQTFADLADYAAENGVSVVLIAGDLFDTQRISATTVGCVLDAIAAHPEVDFLYLRGNHDESARAFAGAVLPKNLKLFSDRWEYHRYGNVVITGAELTDSNHLSLYGSLKLSPKDVNIVTLHGQESTVPGPELVCLPSLRGKNIRYLALGHLHSYRLQQLDHSGEYCYCGCLEGRGFDECGEKGFVLIDIDADRLRSRFVPFARRQLHEFRVDITGQTQSNRICTAMLEAAADVPRKDLVKFTLCGSYTPETNKDLPHLTHVLQNRFFAVKLADESRLLLEHGSYENDISLKGEFTRLVLAAGLPEDDRDAVLLAGLQALSGEEVAL